MAYRDNIEKHQDLIRGCLLRLYEDFKDTQEHRETSVVVDESVDFSTRTDKRPAQSLSKYLANKPDSYAILSK